MLPWDADLSFGHMWTCNYQGEAACYAYYDPRLFITNAYSQTTLGIGAGNRFADALFNNPAIYQMYLRRVRTITDEQLQPPNTHPYLLKYENMVNTLAAQIAPDAALDFAKWIVPNANLYPPTQMLAQATADLNGRYFPLRRQWITPRSSTRATTSRRSRPTPSLGSARSTSIRPRTTRHTSTSNSPIPIHIRLTSPAGG